MKRRKSKELGHVPWLAALWGDRGACWSSRMTSFNHSHKPAQNQTTSWLVHSWNTFSARTSNGQTQIHKIHHGPNLGEATTFPLIVLLYASPRSPHPNGLLSRDSQIGVPKFPRLGLLRLWGPINLCVDLRLRWSLKQSCNPHWDLSNGMSHFTWM
jgi:hypothetical protein